MITGEGYCLLAHLHMRSVSTPEVQNDTDDTDVRNYTYLKFHAGAYVFYYHILPVIRSEKPEKKKRYLVSVYPALSSKMLNSIQQHYDINLGIRRFGSDY